MNEKKSQKKVTLDNADHPRDELQKAEKMAHDILRKKEAEEKRYLLQAVIREAEESGFPMPPSLIKLLNHTNGKKFLLFLLFLLYCLTLF